MKYYTLSFLFVIIFIISGYVIGFYLGNHSSKPITHSKLITHTNIPKIIPPVKE